MPEEVDADAALWVLSAMILPRLMDGHLEKGIVCAYRSAFVAPLVLMKEEVSRGLPMAL